MDQNKTSDHKVEEIEKEVQDSLLEQMTAD